MKKEYLKSLDTFRAIAALVVVWSHIEFVKPSFDIEKINFTLFPNAHYSVTLFFVLSGFLITYLLTKEKEKYQTIFFKKFYIRRILRIWPLYYLVLILSYVLISSNVSYRTILLCSTFFSNIPPALKSGWEGSPQVWSIGVEEQFYLFWPLFIYFIPNRRMNYYIVSFIILYTFLPFIIQYLLDNIGGELAVKEKLYSFSMKFFHLTKFNCMAFGGLLGYNLALDKKWLKFFYSNKYIVWGVTLCVFSIWFLDVTFGRLTEEVYALLFGMMIIGCVRNQYVMVDTKMGSFLGKISYGIYMYHWIILILIMKYTSIYKEQKFYDLFLYGSVFFITIMVSWLSFNTIEKHFLNIKTKYES